MLDLRKTKGIKKAVTVASKLDAGMHLEGVYNLTADRLIVISDPLCPRCATNFAPGIFDTVIDIYPGDTMENIKERIIMTNEGYEYNYEDYDEDEVLV